MSEKTGLPVERIAEHHTTQTCPKCLTRQKPRGRTYNCKNPECDLVAHRDVVGTGNIGARAEHGGTSVSKDTPIVAWIDRQHDRVLITYQQAVQLEHNK